MLDKARKLVPVTVSQEKSRKTMERFCIGSCHCGSTIMKTYVLFERLIFRYAVTHMARLAEKGYALVDAPS